MGSCSTLVVVAGARRWWWGLGAHLLGLAPGLLGLARQLDLDRLEFLRLHFLLLALLPPRHATPRRAAPINQGAAAAAEQLQRAFLAMCRFSTSGLNFFLHFGQGSSLMLAVSGMSSLARLVAEST